MHRSAFTLLALVWVACSSDAVAPIDAAKVDASADGGSATDAAPDAPADVIVDASAEATVDAGPPQPNFVFVTSTTSDAKTVASPTNADKICNDLAKAKSLPGAYVAWLASPGTNASTRLGAARGWVRPDGKPVADTMADLVGGKIYYPPNLDEGGKVVSPSSRVLTGARGDGKDVETCSGWTDFTAAKSYTAGAAGAGGELWTQRFTDACDTTGSIAPRLYCFGVDREAPITKPTPSGRLVFLSKGTVAGNAGIGAMDALCRTEATAANIGGARTYKALVATESTTGAARFANTSGPIARTDGVVIAPTAADLFAASFALAASVNVHADGLGYELGANGPWTGSDDMTKTGGAACGGWGASGPGAIAGTSAAIDGDRYGGVVTTCDELRPVYCLQE